MENVKSWSQLDNKSVTINGKVIPLRYTVYQMEQLEKLRDSNEAEGDKSLKWMAAQDLDLCQVVLNPVADEVYMTREEISQSLDLDQIKILTKYWLINKVFTPELTKN